MARYLAPNRTALRAALRADMPLTDIPGGKVEYKRFPSPQALIRWFGETGAHDAIIDATRTESDSWNGLGPQSIQDILTTGRPENALTYFNAATAKLEAHAIPGGRMKPAIAGGTWIIPEYLAGNPLCARIKPRTKLPHKAFRFALQCSAYTNQADLSLVGATISRALWDYNLSGGTATLTMFYIYGYSTKADNGAEAACYEVNVPFASDSALALAMSAALYRPIGMQSVSYALSPINGDSIPMKFHLKPAGSTLLRGNPSEDFPKLRALGIDCGVAP